MFFRLAVFTVFCITVAMPSISMADPPDHAPAHGYRNKTKAKQHESQKVEIVFDSERGVRVVVGMPGIFFEAGKYYRYKDDSWRVSANVDGGWSVVAAGAIPHAIAKTRPHPGPAKVKVKPRKK
jgi:hypothetical protein